VKDERTYLLHAIAAIDAIQSYTTEGREAFFADGKTQDAVIRNIEIIGQAVKGISGDTRALDTAAPWRQIAGMRDKLIHEYFGVDLALVWDAVERSVVCSPGGLVSGWAASRSFTAAPLARRWCGSMG
jgi:uncharacterized protein with HEPN domain